MNFFIESIVSHSSDGENERKTKTVAYLATKSYEQILWANVSSIFNAGNENSHLNAMFLLKFTPPEIELKLYLVFISTDGIECIFHEKPINFEPEMSCH